MNNASGKKYGTHLGNNNKMEFATNKPIVSVVSEQTYFSCRIKNSEYDFNSELKNKEELSISLFTLQEVLTKLVLFMLMENSWRKDSLALLS